MLKKFIKYVSINKLFEKNNKLLVAVSGGMDSVLLCHLLNKAGFMFGIAHCNFQLRKRESDADEKFVRQIAKQFNVPFYVKKFNTQNYADVNGMSVQMAARELRYQWFETIRVKNKFDLIAVAHHQDDEVETFFINLIRGTGIAGLHGINAKAEKIVRPLLFTNRKEIENFIIKEKIKYRDDSSNSSDKYLRNKIRHKLIPLLEEMNPNIKDSVKSTISRIRRIENIFKSVVEKEKVNILKNKKSHITLDINALLKLKNHELYLYEFLKPYGFSGEIIEKVAISLNAKPGKIFFSSTHKLVKDRKYLIITSLDNDSEQKEYEISGKTKTMSIPIKMKFTIKEYYPDFKIPQKKNTAILDFGKLNFPLSLRTWKIGDYFYPFGMESKKKLSDFFTDIKLSLYDKENVWLLCNGNEIVWVIGHRIDNRYKVTDKTKKVYIAEIVNK